MNITRITKAQNGVWVVTETSSMDGQSQTDETTLEKRTLIIRSRVFRAKGAVADLKFDGRMATGTITDGKEKHTINTDVGGVIFADGASGGDVMAALPLSYVLWVEKRTHRVVKIAVSVPNLRDALATAELTK